MVVPFAPGGPTDLIGRFMAPRMSEVIGAQIVIENMGGAA
jgi:tripartite-type tricarboxylate transporter receptor subunit TctC